MEASWGESKAYILNLNTKLPEEKGDLKGTIKASLTTVLLYRYGEAHRSGDNCHWKDSLLYSQTSRWEQAVLPRQAVGTWVTPGRGGNYGRAFAVVSVGRKAAKQADLRLAKWMISAGSRTQVCPE